MRYRRLVPFVGVLVSAAVAITAAAAASTPADCATLRHHGHRAEAQACYESLARATDPYLRAEGNWGLEHYEDANAEFRAAVARADQNALYRVRWGRLLHERFNNTEAAHLFEEALQRDAKNAGAYVGLALVSADGFDSKAREYATKALQIDPKLVEAHELLAGLALEDSDEAEAIKEADAALGISTDALDAMAIHAAVELLSDHSPDTWLQKMQQVNATYGDGFALIASHLVMNRRYEDGVAYYRKAIALDPRLWSARSQLGINLMRLGQEEEPRQQLQQCYNNGYRDAATVNSLRLLDSLKTTFASLKTDTTILKLDQKEANLLQPYLDDLLKRAIATYSQKYAMTLPGPVQVEVYPNHEDFAVRTYGMPGLGALGVTFGTVVAMDSPSGRPPGSFNWASTLWHEMNHVFVLTATRHRVPRWFAEGVAVHEEGQGNPRWANRLTPEIVVALKDKKLLPVAQLDRGFVRPDYPAQILVSYYQAGRICDYIESRWGAGKLVDMVHRFARLEPTPDVIQHALTMTPAEFDTQFQAWLDKEAGPIVTHFDEWRTRLKRLVDLFNRHQYEEAATEGEAVRRMYPEYVGDANAYALLADVHIAQGNKAAAIAVLADYQKFGGENPATLKKLASLQEEAGQLREAAATLDEINEIYPVNDEELHRRLGDLWLTQNNYPAAIREYAGVVALHPLDKAGALYNLAKAYFAARQVDKAEQQVLAALEVAPGYRPAQQLLLQIEDAHAKRP
jgi:tetratricopeptide (TPR) repeat protein